MLVDTKSFSRKRPCEDEDEVKPEDEEDAEDEAEADEDDERVLVVGVEEDCVGAEEKFRGAEKERLKLRRSSSAIRRT
jgi:hypothetical protein